MIDAIIDKACELWGVTREEILGNSRKEPLPLARAMIAYTIREYLGFNSTKIGETLHKHHSTIIYYFDLYKNEYKFNKEFFIFANMLNEFTLQESGLREKEFEEMVKGFKKKNKYNNKKAEYNGLVFDSTKEKDRYIFLKELEEQGVISNLQPQVKFELIPAVKEEYVEHLKTKDKVKTRTLQLPITWTADFVYTKENGEEVVEDVKPSKFLLSDRFVIKEKLFFWKYGKRIRIVYKANEDI